jgi:multicomponent Na+:H+ antiporter subunit F
MNDFIIQTGIFLCVAGMLASFIRLLRGPGLANRILALDAITIQSLVLIAGLALDQQRAVILLPLLVIALVAFIATVSLSRLIDPPPP